MKKIEVFKTVNNLIRNKKLYHSIIIMSADQNDLIEIANELIRQIYCLNNSNENDRCAECLKVINKNNLNTLFIGDGLTKISKEDIKELMIRFSTTGIEENQNKVYVISNGENLSENAANSLLKFLEEPPKNTYSIILTNDRNQILSTIKSRCKFFSVEAEDKKVKVNSEIVDLVLSKNKLGLLEYLISFKKMDKSNIVEILNITFDKAIELQINFLQEILLDAINEIKNTTYINLILENLFIKVYEVL